MKWFLKCLAQYFDFKGRARRSEYWWFMLVCTAIIVVVIPLLGLISESTAQVVAVLFVLATTIPAYAVTARRMHDVGKSGWFMLVPFYGLYLALLDSEPGRNAYGPSPKGSIT